MKRSILSVLFVISSLLAHSQQGGSKAYQFLTVPNSARIGALGGNQVGLCDNDLNLVFHNPGILSDSMSNKIVFNYVPVDAGIKYGYVGYARHFKNIGTLALGIHNINYGDFIGKDEYDQDLGNFKAAEYAIMLTYSKRLSKTIIGGITFKPIISKLQNYKSFALASDIGVSYRATNSLFTAGMALKNIGSQITTFDGVHESLPFDLQMGLSKKMAHAPFRLNYTLQGLLEWDLEYEPQTPENGSANSTGVDYSISVFDNFMRHSVIGVDIVLSKNFYLAAGYNHRRRQELKIQDLGGAAGYSFGFGLRVSKFNVAYASSFYHLAGASNMFSLSTNLSSFKL